MKENLKEAAFRGIGAAEKAVRRFGGRSASLDPANLQRIRKFVLPFFEPYLGALVHDSPVLEALRSAVPDAEIVVAAAPLARQVFQHHPLVDRLVAVPDPNRDFRAAVHGLRSVVRSLAGDHWCALFTGWNSRTRVALAVMLSGDGLRAGYCIAPELLHLPLRFDKSLSQIANNVKIVTLLGHEVPSHLEPRLYFSQSDLGHAEALIGARDRDPVAVLITRTSGGQPTAWPDARFAAVGRNLIQRHGCRVLLPGLAGDADALSRLAQEIGGAARSLAGKTTIAQLGAVCALSDIAVSVDTGALHVARAQGLPVAILAPAWQDSIEWMPINKPWARILKGPWFPPPPPRKYALEEITVEQVTTAAEDLLRAYPPSDAPRQERVRRSLVPSELSQLV